jgi:hypothetical protein
MKAPVIMLASMLWLTGCLDEPRVAGSEKKVADAGEASKTIVSLEKQVQNLAVKPVLQSRGDGVYLTPGSAGYSAIRFDLGTMTIAIDDIQPFANGSKVTLRIGNPLTATINGLKAKIEWGEVDEQGLPKDETAKSKDVIFSEELRSGTWTRVYAVLDGVRAEKLGFIRVKDVGHQGIALSKSW